MKGHKKLRGKQFTTDAPHTRSRKIDRIGRATFFYRNTNALMKKKKVLIRLYLHVSLPQGRGITSISRLKHGLNKNAVTNCASQTGVRAAKTEFCVC